MAAVGFDASSVDSCVDVWKNVGVETIVIDQGSRKTPTCVVFTNIERLIGKARKKKQTARNPESTVVEAKQLIERKFADPEIRLTARCDP